MKLLLLFDFCRWIFSGEIGLLDYLLQYCFNYSDVTSLADR
jgi:hypothetical protein